MKALILGGAGFIGAHLTRRLLDEGHEVTMVDDFSRGARDTFIEDLTAHPGATAISGDLTDRATWDLFTGTWDQVYLLAAVVGVRNVERDPGRVIHVNTMTVMHLLDWVPAGTRVFFSSTSEVYAGGVSAGLVPVPTPEDIPVMIEDVTLPRFAYAISKLLGEAAITHGLAARGATGVIGRFHNVYGPRMGLDHVVPEMLMRASGGENPFAVPGADQQRAFCHVDDAVAAVLALMAAPEAAGRLVHIGNDTEETRIADLADLVFDVVGAHPEVQATSAPTGSVPRRQPDCTLLRELTGWQPQVGLAEGVRRTWEWYAAQSDLRERHEAILAGV